MKECPKMKGEVEFIGKMQSVLGTEKLGIMTVKFILKLTTTKLSNVGFNYETTLLVSDKVYVFFTEFEPGKNASELRRNLLSVWRRYILDKNAVQRLQKLENDIKTVISVYEATKNSQNKNNDTDTETEIKSEYPLAVISDGYKTKWSLTEKCTSAFEHFKKLTSFCPGLGSRIQFSPETKDNAVKKPKSAPSSSCSTLCESDYYLWQPTSDSNNPKWTDLSDSYTALMTPSKTLQVANEVLGKNNFQTDNFERPTDSAKGTKIFQNEEQDYARGQRLEVSRSSNVKPQTLQKIIAPKFGRKEKQKTFAPTNYITALVEKEFAKNAKFASNESTQEIAHEHHLVMNKIPPLVKERLENFEILNKEKNFPDRSEGPKRPAKTSLSKSIEKINCAGNERRKSGDRYEKENKGKPEQKNSKNSNLNFLSAQKIKKEEENGNISAIELFKIIEKSNEKLEKMQMSKTLALDIAAQLKEKHEEMRHSKENMIEKLQKLEKDNERLSTEIKDAREKKRKLQLKMEGFCSYSKAKLLKQDLKSREILEENEWLKAKIQELEKKYNENYIEKLAEMDKTQRDKLTEIKNELRARETRAEEEIKKLIYEKATLLKNVKELNCSLQERQSKVEKLEEKISVLKKEVEKQKETLKEKTKRLEETHKELESIRQNSRVLEEQVKTLRTNIENFDLMQRNLTNGIADRENQIKTNQTEIEKLQQENTNLKKEMEKEKDSILIKNKIIEDQQETIKQMREKTEEAKNLLKKNQSLERLLNREREEKLELQEALECVKMKKEELKKKIKSLEADLLFAPEEVVKDLQKTQMVLHELENQVHIKQKEWEHHLQLLIKEKEQACSIAEFATKKLMQTTSKFQKQSEAHKKLHQVLAENLAEKERHLRETLSKGSCNQLQTVGSDMTRTNRQVYARQCNMGNENPRPTNVDWQQKKLYAVEEIRPEGGSYFF